MFYYKQTNINNILLLLVWMELDANINASVLALYVLLISHILAGFNCMQLKRGVTFTKLHLKTMWI